MSSCFRTPFARNRLHGPQRLLEPELEHFHRNFQLILKKLSWKTSLLVRCKILGLFGNTLTADLMYSRLIWEKLRQQVQMVLSKKRSSFSLIFFAFLECTQNFDHFEIKKLAS